MERILVGYDGSEAAAHALAQACRLTQLYEGALTVLTAADGRMVREDGVVTMAADESLAQWTAEQGAEWARQNGLERVDTRVVVQPAGDAIVSVAKEGYDLLVVGHKGHTALQELFLGSTAKYVVDHVECSVLVVR